jgi:hypothetical protein
MEDDYNLTKLETKLNGMTWSFYIVKVPTLI